MLSLETLIKFILSHVRRNITMVSSYELDSSPYPNFV